MLIEDVAHSNFAIDKTQKLFGFCLTGEYYVFNSFVWTIHHFANSCN